MADWRCLEDGWPADWRSESMAPRIGLGYCTRTSGPFLRPAHGGKLVLVSADPAIRDRALANRTRRRQLDQHNGTHLAPNGKLTAKCPYCQELRRAQGVGAR